MAISDSDIIRFAIECGLFNNFESILKMGTIEYMQSECLVINEKSSFDHRVYD